MNSEETYMNGTVRQTVFDAIKKTLLSGIIGIVVVIPCIMVYGWEPWITVRRGFIAGLLMGAVCTVGFILILSRNFRYKTFWSFFATFVLIGIISYVYARTVGSLDPVMALTVCVFSEICGMISTSLMYLYSYRLNRKLHLAQEKLDRMKRH